MKTLGIDYGTKKIGLAVSDEEGRVGFPRSVLQNDKNIIPAILQICKNEKIGGIVLGESLDYGGEPNKVMEKISAFKIQLEKVTGAPVYFESEFLTSKQARNVYDSGKNNDASAAALILQSYLDKLKNKK